MNTNTNQANFVSGLVQMVRAALDDGQCKVLTISLPNVRKLGKTTAIMELSKTLAEDKTLIVMPWFRGIDYRDWVGHAKVVENLDKINVSVYDYILVDGSGLDFAAFKSVMGGLNRGAHPNAFTLILQ